MKKTTLCILLMGLLACSGDSPSAAEVDTALAQVEKELHNFHVANEWHYADVREYTADLAQLVEEGHAGWMFPDSVRLEVLDAGAGGYRVKGTHVRLGAGFGCVFAWGDQEGGLSTPGGRPFEGGNQILCDEPRGDSGR